MENLFSIESILQLSFFGNTLESYLIGFSLGAISYLVLYLVIGACSFYIKMVTARTQTKIDDIVVTFVSRLLHIFALRTAYEVMMRYLTLTDQAAQATNMFLSIIITILITWFIQSLIFAVINEYFKKSSHHAQKALIPFMKNIVKVFLWLISATFILSNLGYSITSLAAGLGLGGIAIALAVRPSLESFISSISIFTDQNIEVDDAITFDGKSGIVNRIGLKTSYITTFDGTKLSVPNSTLTSTIVENYTKRDYFRVNGSIKITYDVDSKTLEKVMKQFIDIINKQADIDTNGTLVWFEAFSDISYIVNYMYVITTADYPKYIYTKSKIHEAMNHYLESIDFHLSAPISVYHVNSPFTLKK